LGRRQDRATAIHVARQSIFAGGIGRGLLVVTRLSFGNRVISRMTVGWMTIGRMTVRWMTLGGMTSRLIG